MFWKVIGFNQRFSPGGVPLDADLRLCSWSVLHCFVCSRIGRGQFAGAAERRRGLNGLQGPLREVTYGPDESKPEPNALRLRAP